MDFCILSAGIGSRFSPFSDYANKTLAPFPFEPLISQIIEAIPKNNRIFIVTGYLNRDLEEIVKEIHSDRDIIISQNLAYRETGMGDSLLSIIDDISESFVVIPNDGIYRIKLEDKLSIYESDIVVGSSLNTYDKKDYTVLKCNTNNDVLGLKRFDIVQDSNEENLTSKLFTGFLYVKNKHKYKEYLSKYPSGQREIYFPIKDYIRGNKTIKSLDLDWVDCGTYEKYKRELKNLVDYDFSKSNETLLIYKDKRVYKIFSDSDISIKRVKKSDMYPMAFPKCRELPSKFGYSYEYMEGNTLYEESSRENLENLLKFLETNLWEMKPENINLYNDGYSFYKQKTIKRINLLEEKFNFNQIKSINNQKLNYISLIPPFKFEEIISNIHPSPIHGDLQYDNVLVDSNKNFLLIDWRHEFGSNIKYGDLYYDLAKLLGGILLNYKKIKQGKFEASLSKDGRNIFYKYDEDKYVKEHQEIIYDFHFRNNLNINNTRKLLSLIYINMAPLHEPPFDILLLAFANKIFWSND